MINRKRKKRKTNNKEKKEEKKSLPKHVNFKQETEHSLIQLTPIKNLKIYFFQSPLISKMVTFTETGNECVKLGRAHHAVSKILK